MTQAIGEALAGARDAGRVARELDAFVGVWDAPRSRHAAALVMAGDGDRVARAARALAASSRARVLWAAEPVDWRAVKRHLYDARRHGARALVVVDGCEARTADAAAPAESLIDPLRSTAVDLGLPGAAPIEMGHAAFVWTLADASACTGAKRAALAALRARWGSDLPDAWYNRVPFSAAVCAE